MKPHCEVVTNCDYEAVLAAYRIRGSLCDFVSHFPNIASIAENMLQHESGNQSRITTERIFTSGVGIITSRDVLLNYAGVLRAIVTLDVNLEAA